MTDIITTDTLTISEELYLTNILRSDKIKSRWRLPMTDIIKSDKVTTLVDFQRPISLRQVKLRSMKTFNDWYYWYWYAFSEDSQWSMSVRLIQLRSMKTSMTSTDITRDDTLTISEDFDLTRLIGVLNLRFGFGPVCFGVWSYPALLAEITTYQKFSQHIHMHAVFLVKVINIAKFLTGWTNAIWSSWKSYLKTTKTGLHDSPILSSFQISQLIKSSWLNGNV